MDPLSMERAMISKMIERTGKSIEQWIEIVKDNDFSKHGEIVKFLKQEHSLTHGYANLIARNHLEWIRDFKYLFVLVDDRRDIRG